MILFPFDDIFEQLIEHLKSNVNFPHVICTFDDHWYRPGNISNVSARLPAIYLSSNFGNTDLDNDGDCSRFDIETNLKFTYLKKFDETKIDRLETLRAGLEILTLFSQPPHQVPGYTPPQGVLVRGLAASPPQPVNEMVDHEIIGVSVDLVLETSHFNEPT